MRQDLQKKYYFDLKTGHYKKVLLTEEAEATQGNGQNNQQSNDNTENNNQQTVVQLPNTDSPEIAQVQQDKLNKVKALQDNISRLEQNKVLIANKLSDAASKEGADRNQLLSLKKQQFQVESDIEDRKFDIAKIEHDDNIKILKMRMALLESEFTDRLPEKYKWLNESNIHTAKLYMKGLVGSDESIIKGMADFKRVFNKANLLYGKDKNDYYVIAIDQEDFDKTFDALQEVGYLRDEIIDHIMPQVLDRKEMIK